MKATSAGWTPKWFSQYRFYLSILVGGCIIATLLGVNHFGPTTDVVLKKDLHEIGGLGGSGALMDRNVRDMKSPSAALTLPDDAGVVTVPASEADPGYVKLVHLHNGQSGEDEDGKGMREGTPGDDAGQPGVRR